jgi:CubicO group peptidase (beta-lactamase class C family)
MAEVTLHLLTHTSGIGHWDAAPGFGPSQPMNPDQRLALIQQAPLLTEPLPGRCGLEPPG